MHNDTVVREEQYYKKICDTNSEQTITVPELSQTTSWEQSGTN